VHTFEERTPVALSIHHVPFSVSFALFDLPGVKAGGSGKAASHSDESTSEVRLAIDPTALEQSIMDGRLSFVLNAPREVVAVRKSSSGSGGAGCAVPQDLVMRGMLQAVASVATLDAVLTAALVEGEAEAERVRLSARPTEQIGN
jgi:exosome complex component RRP45